MKIKVCGMKSPQNIQELIQEIDPDYMGLIFYQKSPRFVSEENSAWIKTLNIPKVGVFVNESIDNILNAIEKFGLSVIQLHGTESPDFLKILSSKTDAKIWKVISIGESVDWDSMNGYVGLVEYFLFDTATKTHGGSGKKFDWSILKTYPFQQGFLLSGGIDESNADEIRELSKQVPQLVGVDLNSRFEDAPGLKNIDKLKGFKKSLLGGFDHPEK